MDTAYEERGYLTEDYRLFHLRDRQTAPIDWHYHTFHKIILFLAGDGHYAIEGQRYALRAGDILLVGSGCIHRPEISPDRDYERIILYISPAFLRHLGGDTPLETCFDRARADFSFVLPAADDLPALRELFRCLENREDAFGAELLRQAALMRLMVALTRRIQSGRTTSVGGRSDAKVTAILQYLAAHLTEPVSIDDLAAQFYLSKYHMMRKFKEETGYTIHSYLTSKRLLAAHDLIAAGTPATAACYRSGFQDYSAFSRAYKKQFGVSPRRTVV